MTRQHKATSEELQERMAELETEQVKNKEEIDDLIAQKKKIETDTKTIEEEKDNEIKGYRANIDQLQSEFGSMLSDTLVKIKLKIDQANA